VVREDGAISFLFKMRCKGRMLGAARGNKHRFRGDISRLCRDGGNRTRDLISESNWDFGIEYRGGACPEKSLEPKLTYRGFTKRAVYTNANKRARARVNIYFISALSNRTNDNSYMRAENGPFARP